MGERFKVYFSWKQLNSRSTNVKRTSDIRRKDPLLHVKLMSGKVVPYTQLVDEHTNYKPLWDDAEFLGYAKREEIGRSLNGNNVDELARPIDHTELGVFVEVDHGRH